MKQDYHSAYGKPFAGIDHEHMRFLQLRKERKIIPKPLDKAGGIIYRFVHGD